MACSSTVVCLADMASIASSTPSYNIIWPGDTFGKNLSDFAPNINHFNCSICALILIDLSLRNSTFFYNIRPRLAQFKPTILAAIYLHLLCLCFALFINIYIALCVAFAVFYIFNGNAT